MILVERGILNMAEKHKCPVCGKYEFEEQGSYDICEVCGWEDDPIQGKDPDRKGGANNMSLNEAIEAYKNGKQVN
jgi:rubredoxin